MTVNFTRNNLNKFISSDRLWTVAPYLWLFDLSKHARGQAVKSLFYGWCAARGLDVVRSPDSDADRIIGGARVEIKFSTEWEGGQYVFQQVRDQEYRFLICIGVSPFDAQAWIFEKRKIPFQKLKHQHGGDRGRDTWWIAVDPAKPPAWMGGRGSFSNVYKTLAAAGKRRR